MISFNHTDKLNSSFKLQFKKIKNTFVYKNIILYVYFTVPMKNECPENIIKKVRACPNNVENAPRFRTLHTLHDV